MFHIFKKRLVDKETEKEEETREFLMQSQGFDEAFYLSRNPDVADARADPLMHYLRYGWLEGRDPNSLFNVNWYLSQNPDVAKATVEPLTHYLRRGWLEGRAPNPLFDTDWYLSHYPDVAEAGANPLVHYLRVGWLEGRDPNPLFDTDWYLSHYPDVAKTMSEPLTHYMQYGWLEGRDPSPLFDTDWYLSHYPDVAKAKLEPLMHYLRAGWLEGRDPNPLFDTDWYRATYLAGDETTEPLAHYIEGGWRNGCSPHPLFDVPLYLERYQSTIENGVDPLTHYLQRGWLEGQDPNPLFDTDWYRATYLADDATTEPLAHYIEGGWRSGCSPHPLFDVVPYIEQYQSVMRDNVDPLTHYLQSGWREKREVFPPFDEEAYLARSRHARNSDMAPLAHFAMVGGRHARTVTAPFDARYYTLVNPDLADLSEDEAWQHFVAVGYAEGRLSAAVREPVAEEVDDTELPRAAAPKAERLDHDLPKNGTAHYTSPLVISGFHRSGTSMTANLFANAGLFLGETLLGANYSNPYGHFEDTEVIEFHDRVLEKSGTSWHADTPFIPILGEDDWRWLFEYGTRRSAYPSWGFKDPRNCLFLPQWASVFPDMTVLYVYRPCIECVHSIKRRAAKDILLGRATRINRKFWLTDDLAIKMYIVYAEAALRFLENFSGRSLVVDLEDLLAGRDLVSEVRRTWGYALADADIGDVFDAAVMSRYGANEVVHDRALLDRVGELEMRFRDRMRLGFVDGRNGDKAGTFHDYAAV